MKELKYASSSTRRNLTNYKLSGKVYLWQADAAWHFVDVGKQVSKEIMANVPFKRGFGSVPVKATIGKSSWKTSIFPDKKRGYVLPLKKKVRGDEGFGVGDKIEFEIEVID